MCQILRDDTFLRTMGEQIGQVIAIDNSEAYRAKVFGPRIRLLIQDLNTIPYTIVLPRLDGKGVVEYNLEYSGLPNQCGQCRSKEHQVSHCPKKDAKLRKRGQQPSQQHTRRGPKPQMENTVRRPPTPGTLESQLEDIPQTTSTLVAKHNPPP